MCQIPSVSAACTHAMPYPSYNFRHSRQMLLHSPLQKPFSPLSAWLVRPSFIQSYIRLHTLRKNFVWLGAIYSYVPMSGYFIVHFAKPTIDDFETTLSTLSEVLALLTLHA